jgi:MoaA/NifB/PqqE/SkfB family radical SAM enzyme
MRNIRKDQSARMDLDTIRTHAKNLRDFGIGYVFLQGGEPTLRKDLVEVTDIFLKNGIKPTVISNGILFASGLASGIADRVCNMSISLDSLDREEYKKIRGVDALETVMRNIRQSSGLKRRGNWSIVTTVTGLSTLEGIRRLETFAQENGLGKRCADLICEPEKAVQIFEYMAGQARKNNFLAGLLYEEYIRYVNGWRMAGCDAMKFSFLLQETGVFSPCIEFPGVWKILVHAPAIIRQMAEYSQFF